MEMMIEGRHLAPGETTTLARSGFRPKEFSA